MDHDISYKQQILPVAQKTCWPVATVLIGQNTLLRMGISHILSGTRFVLAEDAPCDVSAGAGASPVLFLIGESRPSDDYVEMIKQVKAQCPTARVVLLVDHLEPQAVMQACHAGMDGLCPPAMSRSLLINALELVMLGETFIPGSFGLTLIGQMLSGPRTETNRWIAPVAANDSACPGKLSAREAQILRYLTQGASNKLIARELGVAEATVKVHVKAILRKVKAGNRTQAALWAQQHLTIEPSSQPAMPGE